MIVTKEGVFEGKLEIIFQSENVDDARLISEILDYINASKEHKALISFAAYSRETRKAKLHLTIQKKDKHP